MCQYQTTEYRLQPIICTCLKMYLALPSPDCQTVTSQSGVVISRRICTLFLQSNFKKEYKLAQSNQIKYVN